MDQAEVRFRVRYAETDQMGVVYHANYLAWMEMARTELCRVRGVRYRDIEREDGVSLAVVEVNCRYRAPALYDDQIVARGRLAASNARIVTFAYEILNAETGKLLVTGETRHVFLDREGKPVRVPERLKRLFQIGEE